MAELLLINPRRRARKARRASPARAKRRTSVRRRRNPVVLAKHSPVRRRARRGNPIRARRASSRRRRNPISLGGLRSGGIMAMLKAAFIGGAGAAVVDFAYGSIMNPILPASMAVSPMSTGIGDGVKAAFTIAIGHFLDKPTKGLAKQAAVGALTVQFRDILAKSVLPTSGGLAGLRGMGWATPARVIPGTARVGPSVVRRGMGAFMRPGSASPMLNAFQRPGASSPLLSNGSRVRDREGIQYR